MGYEKYIPAKDADALTWMKVFRDGIQIDPSKYFLSPSDAANISDVVNDFEVKYLVASTPSTRTSSSVLAKDISRNVAEQLCRSYAIQIKYNAGISDEDKNDIGVRPVNPTRTPIIVPTSFPLLAVLGNTPGAQTVRYTDSSTPDNKAKPFGASAMQLYVAVADEPVLSADDAQLYGVFTKNPIGVGFDSADNGKYATYFARWQSPRGDVGPWSLPVAMTIAA